MVASSSLACLLIVAGQSNNCAPLVAELESAMQRSVIAMEPQSAISVVYQRATQASERCPDNESVAYWRLRALELGRGTIVGRQPKSTLDEWRAMAAELSRRFPTSARIVTIQARATGSIDDARKAVELDPSYPPAQVALGVAWIPSDPARAARHLAGVARLAEVSDGFTALARARYAARDLIGAANAARSVFRKRKVYLVEPDGRDSRPTSQAHEVLGLVALTSGRYREAARELQAAVPDCEGARAILADPPKELRPFLPSVKRKSGPGI